jgi:hypothetical protein
VDPDLNGFLFKFDHWLFQKGLNSGIPSFTAALILILPTQRGHKALVGAGTSWYSL